MECGNINSNILMFLLYFQPLKTVLKPGCCMRISTGAPVPPGADAIVQVEDTDITLASPDNTKEIEINIKIKPKAEQEIR